MIPSCYRPPPIRTVIAVSDIEPDYLNIRNPCGRTERRFLLPNSQTRSWPSSCIGSGADYGVDFSTLLCGDDHITQVSIDAGGAADVAWETIIDGTIAVAWLTWTAAGLNRVNVSVVTAGGASFTRAVMCSVSPTVSLIAASAPEDAPNAFTAGDVFFPDTTGSYSLISG